VLTWELEPSREEGRYVDEGKVGGVVVLEVLVLGNFEDKVSLPNFAGEVEETNHRVPKLPSYILIP